MKICKIKRFDWLNIKLRAEYYYYYYYYYYNYTFRIIC